MPLVWSAASLPNGLSLNDQQGQTIMIAGIPTEARDFSFEIMVTDSVETPQSASKTLSLKVVEDGPACRRHDISMEGFMFVERNLTIKACDMVVWTHNQGQIPHTVTSGEFKAANAGAIFDSRPAGQPDATLPHLEYSSIDSIVWVRLSTIVIFMG